MTWYYVEAGQQAGPVDDSQLEGLARAGRIQPDTLVWREGMTNWQPYQTVMPAANPVAAGVPAAPAPLLASGGNEAVCAECGGIFNVQDMIRHGGMHVCANCKPVFMQKLAEGARLNTGVEYAGFWIRFGAVFLDGIILYAVNMVMGMALGLSFAQRMGFEPRQASFAPLLLVFLQTLVAITYETVLIGRYGATLGKMACKIRVVTADGGKVSYLRALGRYFAKMLSYIICLAGLIMAAFDDEKRGLHDRICNTRVVMK